MVYKWIALLLNTHHPFHKYLQNYFTLRKKAGLFSNHWEAIIFICLYIVNVPMHTCWLYSVLYIIFTLANCNYVLWTLQWRHIPPHRGARHSVGLFTLHANRTSTDTANRTGIIGNNGFWSLPLCQTSVNISTWYRSGTVNSKSFVGKVLLRIKWKFKLN